MEAEWEEVSQRAGGEYSGQEKQPRGRESGGLLGSWNVGVQVEEYQEMDLQRYRSP